MDEGDKGDKVDEVDEVDDLPDVELAQEVEVVGDAVLHALRQRNTTSPATQQNLSFSKWTYWSWTEIWRFSTYKMLSKVYFFYNILFKRKTKFMFKF